jgi:hypothetical protein
MDKKDGKKATQNRFQMDARGIKKDVPKQKRK